MIVEDLEFRHVADFLSRPIRPADEQEWLDGLGAHPEDALWDNAKGSTYARALTVPSGETVLLWGCGVSEGVGTIWLIASNYDLSLAPLIHREFAHVEWPKVLALAPVLQAFPSSKNTMHHRWLEHFGFQKDRAIMFPRGSVPFIRYVRRSDVL